jgi:CBS domain-containing protein
MTAVENVMPTRSSKGTSVGDLMSTPVLAVSACDNLARARKLMLSNGVSRLAVVDGGGLEGIVTHKDMGMRLNQSGSQRRRRPLDQIPVNLIMTPDSVTASPDLSVQDAAKTMVQSRFDMLPVIDEELVGQFNFEDILKWLSEAPE